MHVLAPPQSLPAAELTGPPGAPVVVALGGISASRHVAGNAHDPSPGWWEDVAGDGRAIDTARWRLLSFDYLDGGTAPDGGPARLVPTHDQADALAALLDTMEIDRLHALVGASYGGMVALAFAERYPARVARLVVIGAAHESHPMATAVRSVQRQVVRLGLDAGREADGLAIARGLAMTTYRTAQEFATRFTTTPAAVADADAEFAVEGYLAHHGARFAESWTAARFLSLSLSTDLHRVDPAAVTVPTLLVTSADDAIAPAARVRELAGALAAPSRVATLESITGHDAFLTEPAQVSRLLDHALTSPQFP